LEKEEVVSEIQWFTGFSLYVIFLNPSVYRNAVEPHVLVINLVSNSPFTMERTVDVLFLIGFFINLVKGADLILRSHQQKWLQDKCNSLARRLDYTKPLKWYANRKIARAAFLFEPVIFLLVLCLPAIFEFSWFHLLIGICLTLVFLIQILRILSSKDRLEEWEGRLINEHNPPIKILNCLPLQNWLLNSNNFRQRLLRPFYIILLSTALILLIGAAFYGLNRWGHFITSGVIGNEVDNSMSETALLGFLLMAPIIIFVVLCIVCAEFILLGIPSLIILMASLLFLAVEFLLKIIRAIVWRIAEYNKGAFAAIILLITIALGIGELYLKTPMLASPTVSSPTAPAQTSPSPAGTLQSPSPHS
jgi:hypothetical protein